jgi:hypothetical protein
MFLAIVIVLNNHWTRAVFGNDHGPRKAGGKILRMSGRMTAVIAGALLAAAATACSKNADPPGASQTPMPLAQQAPPMSRAGTVIAADLPLLPFPIINTTKPETVVKAAYEFAARHPEVLEYMPCFCGCERGGHRGNHDCFVERRDASGKVAAWAQHGVGCDVCIDVAYVAMQMHNSGAGVAAIREAIDKRYAHADHRTPTPLPKKGADHDH